MGGGGEWMDVLQKDGPFSWNLAPLLGASNCYIPTTNARPRPEKLARDG